jgi:hypothetical protein
MRKANESIRRRGSRFAVDGPGNSEAVGDHAEAFGPEGFGKGDDGFAAVGQGGVDAFGFCGAFNVQREGEAFGLFVFSGRLSAPIKVWA